jgi:hypothetical protein
MSSFRDEERKEENEDFDQIDSSRRLNTPSPATFEIVQILNRSDDHSSIQIEKNLTQLAKEVEGLEIHTKEQLRKRKTKSPNVLVEEGTPSSPKQSPISFGKSKTKFLNVNVPRRDSLANVISPITVSPSVAKVPNSIEEKGILKPTKVIAPTAEQKLFTSGNEEITTKPTSKNNNNKYFLFCILLLVAFALLSFVIYHFFFFKRDRGILLKNYTFLSSKYKLTNSILQKKLSNVCQYGRNEPLSFLFSSSSFRVMKRTTETILKALNQDFECSAFKWTLVYLDDKNIADWKKIIVHKLIENPATVFVLDITGVVPYQYDFMTSAIDGSNAVISHENLQARPVKSLFIWLTDFGSESFDFVRKSTPKQEEKDYKRQMMMKLEIEWPDRIRHRLNYFIPFVSS